MILYPAIDLMDGKCVRLRKGDFNARTDYEDAPATVAKQYEEAGAEWLHIVDLDGSRDPEKRQFSAISSIVASTNLSIQTGGGIRSAVNVELLLALGVKRVIIGSLCVHNPDVTKEILQHYGPDRIVLALDVRGDFDKGFYVAIAGWQTLSEQRIEDVLTRFEGLARHILCTDIAKDGMLAGPNTKLYEYLCKKMPMMDFQASGGISALEDLRMLEESGASGAVIGKALYEKRFTLAEALQAVSPC